MVFPSNANKMPNSVENGRVSTKSSNPTKEKHVFSAGQIELDLIYFHFIFRLNVATWYIGYNILHKIFKNVTISVISDLSVTAGRWTLQSCSQAKDYYMVISLMNINNQ